MNESLFSRLFHYSKTDNRTPQEDYLTELLAWMIDNLPQFGQYYVSFLCSHSSSKIQQNEKCSVNAETQVVVLKGRIDMVITVDSSMCFVCEHKVDSSLDKDQITKYKDCREEIKERYHVENVYYVFLSKIADKLEKEQKPDITIRWHEIYNYFNGKKFDNNSFETLMVKQFLEYLTEVGMGKKESISVKGVEYYSEAMKLERLLKVIFNDLSTDGDWESSCEGINQFLTDYNKPKFYDRMKGEGRIGLEFTSTWHPGLFVGVQLNNKDNSLQSFDSPQLVVIIDCMKGEKSKFQEKDWYKSIDRDKQGKEETENRFRIQTTSDNPWRVLILHKPLTTVLSQCKDDYDKQKNTIKNELIDGINWILNYYKLSFTFDSFEVIKKNSQAFEKAKLFAENADSKPLAIFGGTATGKTHLLYSVKNTIEQNSPDFKVILTTTADMVSTLTNILRSGGTSEQFREKYLQADVLLVDDIQELAGKETTQDELLLLFNAFCESGKRFMMTSSQKETHNGMNARLLCRAFWGDSAEITTAYIKAESNTIG